MPHDLHFINTMCDHHSLKKIQPAQDSTGFENIYSMTIQYKELFQMNGSTLRFFFNVTEAQIVTA